MTSSRSLTAYLVLPIGVAALFAVFPGCAVLPGAGDALCLNCMSSEAGDASFPIDGGAGPDAPTPTATRAALCLGSCNPKNAGDNPDNPLACVVQPDASTPVYDGGGSAVNDAGPDLACRVVQTGSNLPLLECATAGTHGDGAPCNTGADCAAGYECTGSPGACHHYCCSDTECATFYANEPYRFFCDVQPETASPTTLVPVCMLAQSCDLLQNMCGDGMTCTLIDPSKSEATSCVTVGTAGVGDSCEIEHCGANMVCFGAIGSRICRQLCDASHPCTTYSQQCSAQWPTLQKLNVGICQ